MTSPDPRLKTVDHLWSNAFYSALSLKIPSRLLTLYSHGFLMHIEKNVHVYPHLWMSHNCGDSAGLMKIGSCMTTYGPWCIIFVPDCTKEELGNNPLERRKFLHDFWISFTEIRDEVMIFKQNDIFMKLLRYFK